MKAGDDSTGWEAKAGLLNTLLAAGPAKLVVDTRSPGVDVPEEFRGALNLKLNVSPRYGGPPLTVDEFGVTQLLSFSGVGYICRLPWDSIYVMTEAEAKDGPPSFALDYTCLPAEVVAALLIIIGGPVVHDEQQPEATTVPKGLFLIQGGGEA